MEIALVQSVSKTKDLIVFRCSVIVLLYMDLRPRNTILGVRLSHPRLTEVEIVAKSYGLSDSRWAASVLIRELDAEAEKRRMMNQAAMPGQGTAGRVTTEPATEVMTPDASPLPGHGDDGWDDDPAAKEGGGGHGGPGDPGTAPAVKLAHETLPASVISWATVFAEMQLMDAPTRTARFKELKGDRELPAEFGSMNPAQRVEWLDREWPL